MPLAGDFFHHQKQIMSRIKKCPASPNCVCTLPTETEAKRMSPLEFGDSAAAAKSRLKRMLDGMSRVRLSEENGNYLRYTFKTLIGGFIDDVEFEIDEKYKKIDFRSASRKGYSDMGANKRRMKKIIAQWKRT